MRGCEGDVLFYLEYEGGSHSYPTSLLYIPKIERADLVGLILVIGYTHLCCFPSSLQSKLHITLVATKVHLTLRRYIVLKSMNVKIGLV